MIKLYKLFVMNKGLTAFGTKYFILKVWNTLFGTHIAFTIWTYADVQLSNQLQLYSVIITYCIEC